jgi:hypothetical protein
VKPHRGRKSLAERIRENEAALSFYASAAPPDKELPAAPVLRPLPIRLPRGARRRRAVSAEPLERELRKTIVAYLRTRPDIVFAGSFNSGQAVETSSTGNERYIRMNTVPGFPDIHGLMQGGRALYIEVKRPTTRKRLTREQTEFLERARSAGAIAGVAISVEDAAKLIEGRR